MSYLREVFLNADFHDDNVDKEVEEEEARGGNIVGTGHRVVCPPLMTAVDDDGRRQQQQPQQHAAGALVGVVKGRIITPTMCWGRHYEFTPTLAVLREHANSGGASWSMRVVRNVFGNDEQPQPQPQRQLINEVQIAALLGVNTNCLALHYIVPPHHNKQRVPEMLVMSDFINAGTLVELLYGRENAESGFYPQWGGRLHSLRTKTKPLEEATGVILSVIFQVACGLVHAHTRGIIHQSISASNIGLAGEWPSFTAKLMGFGHLGSLGRRSQTGLFTKLNGCVPEYQSPEVRRLRASLRGIKEKYQRRQTELLLKLSEKEEKESDSSTRWRQLRLARLHEQGRLEYEAERAKTPLDPRQHDCWSFVVLVLECFTGLRPKAREDDDEDDDDEATAVWSAYEALPRGAGERIEAWEADKVAAWVDEHPDLQEENEIATEESSRYECLVDAIRSEGFSGTRLLQFHSSRAPNLIKMLHIAERADAARLQQLVTVEGERYTMPTEVRGVLRDTLETADWRQRVETAQRNQWGAWESRLLDRLRPACFHHLPPVLRDTRLIGDSPHTETTVSVNLRGNLANAFSQEQAAVGLLWDWKFRFGGRDGSDLPFNRLLQHLQTPRARVAPSLDFSTSDDIDRESWRCVSSRQWLEVTTAWAHRRRQLSRLSLAGQRRLGDDDIAALANCCALETLDLRRCTKLVDLHALRACTSLTFLNLQDCNPDAMHFPSRQACLVILPDGREVQVPDGGLRRLDLSRIQGLRRATALSSCVALEKLRLDHCDSLTDISALRFCRALTNINLSQCCALTDISALIECTRLTTVDITNSGQICDYRPVAKALTKLILNGDSDRTDVNSLTSCSMLQWLDLSDNCNLADVSALGSCAELAHLDLRSCEKLARVDALASCRQLTWLDVSGCKALNDLSPLVACCALKWLNLARSNSVFIPKQRPCAVTLPNGLEVHESARRVKSLDLRNCLDLTNVAALSVCSALTKLDLRGCDALRDISALRRCTNLTQLDLGQLLMNDVALYRLSTQQKLLAARGHTTTEVCEIAAQTKRAEVLSMLTLDDV